MMSDQKTLLVAVDSGLQAESLRRGLEGAGYVVLEAHDGESALALASAEHPGAVVSDIRMPRMGGYDLCRAIRGDDSLSSIPVILLSELSDSLDVIRGLEVCADAFVTKPFHFPTLVERIESLTTYPLTQEQSGEPAHAKVRLSGGTHDVALDGARLLNLLVSVHETAVLQKRQLDVAQQALEYMHATIDERVHEKTETLRKRVRELRLLQRASRLLSESRLDRESLEELVNLIPAAWMRPGECSARITYRDITVSTAGWRSTGVHQAVSFSTTGGRGTIEVAYVDAPHGEISPVLPDEVDVLDSLAEMLVTYAERDLSEERRKSLENQLRHSQKIEALGTLAGGIAHDFNNLLTAIGGNVELALSARPSEAVRQSLIEINKAFARARDLAKRILLFSRRQESEKKPVAVALVVEEAATLLRATIPRGVEVQIQSAANLPLVLADASQIHQVIMNLGTNAVHALEDRLGAVSMTIEHVRVGGDTWPSPELPAGQYIRVTVSDSGTGISPDVLGRIFDPFFTTKGPGGTGLGLAVVDGIMRDHHGAITVESELGRGTTFRLYFPTLASTTMPIQDSTPAPARGAGQNIMYVDDEEALIRVMTRVLQSLGYRCAGFVDPAAALAAFRADPCGYDAVLADLNMKGMSGLDMARSVVAIRADIPVAIISGSDDVVQRTPEVRAFIQKPATIAELSSALSELLRKATA